MQTLTAPVWLWAVLGGLVVIGAVAVFWVAAGWAERAADWWHDRRDARILLAGKNPTPCGLCGSVDPCEHDEEPSPLPPERTWEQMTSHQLPLGAGQTREELGLTWDGHFLRPPGYLEAERERRAPWWEAEHRAAYESLGFDYPSGLMARVRELTP